MGCTASRPVDAPAGLPHHPPAAPPDQRRPTAPAPLLPPGVRPITSDELFAATAGFSAHRLLGEGGFGRVFEGTWADGGRVAVKVLDAGTSLQGAPEFWAEVAALSAAAPHPNVCPLLGVCCEAGGGTLASVLALAPGGSLRAALGPAGGASLPWPARLRIAAGAAAGLARLHAAGWAHGDVSAGNLLIGPGGDAWLSDLGLARSVVVCEGGGGDAGPPASPRPGTPTPPRGAWAYLAPELTAAAGDQQPDGRPTPAADVFALGVVFLQLLTGAPDPVGLADAVRPRLGRAADSALAGLTPLLDGRLFDRAPAHGGEEEEVGPPAAQAAALAEAAAGCLAADPSARPSAAALASYVAKAVGSAGGGPVVRKRPAAVAAQPQPRRPQVDSLLDAVTALEEEAPPRGGGNPFVL